MHSTTKQADTIRRKHLSQPGRQNANSILEEVEKSGKMGSLLWMAVCQRPSPSRNLHPATVRGRLRTLPSTKGRGRCHGQWERRARHPYRSRGYQTRNSSPPANQQIPQTHRPASQNLPDSVRQLYTYREPSPQAIRPRLLPQS